MQAAVLDVVAGVAVAAAPDADVHIVRAGNLQKTQIPLLSPKKIKAIPLFQLRHLSRWPVG